MGFFDSDSSKKTLSFRLKSLLGFRPRKMKLYSMALRHLSAAEKMEYREHKNSNERLEFLGDAVLDMAVAELVFAKFPFRGEGHLTEVRSKIVSRKQLGSISEKIGLIELIETDGNIPQSRHVQQIIGGNALEALIGAVYLDKGYKRCRTFIYKKIIKPYIDLDEIENIDKNYKSIINQWAQKLKKNLLFKVVTEKNNNRRFTVALIVDGEEISRASHFSKKSAEKLAAAKACENLDLLGEN
jgi:ribonuclease-3